MRHSVYGRKLSRTKNERRRLLQGLARDLFLRGSISTTVAKAKAVQPVVEQLITKAKKGTTTDFRHALRVLADRKLVRAIFDEAKTRFSARTSGFTRIIKTGTRLGDASSMAMLSFVDERIVAEVVKTPTQVPKVSKKS